MGLFQKIRIKRRVATASKDVQMFNIARNEIVSRFHYKTAKPTEGYQIPQSAILNKGQLPQSTLLLGEQQYHPKTQSFHSCWLNRLASKHIQSTMTEKSCPSNKLGWENNTIIIDIPYLNKRLRLGKPDQPVFLTLGCCLWTND